MANGKQTAWWSKALLIGGIVAVVLLPLGALGSRFGIWGFQVGLLYFMGAGVVLAVATVFTGIVAIVVTYVKSLPADRPGAMIGTFLGACVLALMGYQYNTAQSVPPIHDISTDTSNPPVFDEVVALRGPGTNPLDYDSELLASKQHAAYPWVRPLEVPMSVEESLDRTEQVFAEMGIEMVNRDDAAGIVEGTATTFWFGFKDDVVVRVRDAAGGSVVDVRSVSRVGLSDLGTNAARIGEFLRLFSETG